jgi:hypothetical protein
MVHPPNNHSDVGKNVYRNATLSKEPYLGHYKAVQNALSTLKVAAKGGHHLGSISQIERLGDTSDGIPQRAFSGDCNKYLQKPSGCKMLDLINSYPSLPLSFLRKI